MSSLSEKFLIKPKLYREPTYRIAQRASVNPATLSQLITGALRLKPNDERVISVGRILGLKDNECFEDNDGRAIVDSGRSQRSPLT